MISLAQIQNLIRGSNQQHRTLSELRGTISFKDMQRIVSWLPQVRHKGHGVFFGQYPRRAGDICQQPPLQPISTEREIAWAGYMFEVHAVRIKQFLQLAKEYESTLLLNDYSRAHAILCNIEEKVGVSQWSIESRIALIQITDGLEKQKEYANSIRKARPRHDLVAFLSAWISYRNENTVTPGRFTEHLVKMMNRSDADPGLKASILFQVANQEPQNDTAIADILRYAGSFPIIDYYESFLRLGMHVIADGSDVLRQPYIRCLVRLAPLLNDTRLYKALFWESVAGNWLDNVPCRDLTAENELIRGNYSEAVALCRKVTTGDPLATTNWETEAFARVESSQPLQMDNRNLDDRLIKLMYSTISKAPDLKDALVDLERTSLNFRLMGFSHMLRAFIGNETSSSPLPMRRPALLAFLYSPYLEPALLFHFLSRNQREVYWQLLNTKYGDCNLVNLEGIRAGLQKAEATTGTAAAQKPSTEFLLEANVDLLVKECRHSEALPLIQSLKTIRGSRFRRMAIRYELHCLLSLGQLDETLELMVTYALSDPPVIHMLPLEEATMRIDKAAKRRLAGKLSTPIVFDLYSRNVDDKMDRARSFAYEDFLRSRGLQKPSDLEPIVDTFDRDMLLYYLRNLCIPAVMHRSTAFKSTRELEDERQAVVSLLAKLDPDNKQTYETEIHEITRNKIIQKGVREVEQSKIFVDLDGIKRWAKQNLQESFNRYQDLVRVGHEAAAGEQMLVEALAEKSHPKDVLELPKNEAIDVTFPPKTRPLAWKERCAVMGPQEEVYGAETAYGRTDHRRAEGSPGGAPCPGSLPQAWHLGRHLL